MSEIHSLHDFKNRLVQKYQPEKVILFGSRAHGKPEADSDIDILVILRFEGRNAAKSAQILQELDPHFPIDLLVRTPEQVSERLRSNDFFIREIIEKGVVLYEASD